MTAGFAAAEVSLSGSARMGVVSTDGESVFNSRVRVKFTGSGTTDGGLSFGGSFSAQDTAGANSGTAGSTYISGAFGKISMGDVDSGDKAAVGQIDGAVGYTGLGSLNSIAYAADGGFNNDWTEYSYDGEGISAPGAKVLYTYSANGLSISASSSQIGGDASSYGVGASYAAGAVTVGLGYGSAEIDPITVDLEDDSEDYSVEGSITDVSASVGYTMGSTTVKAIYQDSQFDVTVTDDEDVSIDYNLLNAVSTGVSVKNTNGALSLTGYAITTKFESDAGPSGASVSANRYGIGASYDLGGGATLGAGWVHNEVVASENGEDFLTVGEVDAFDAGINFSF